MERGALIGGVAVVGVLAVFAAVFVMVGGAMGTGEAVRRVDRDVDAVTLDEPGGKGRKTDRPIVREDGPDGPRYFDEEGVERMPNPEGRGGEDWERIREQRNQQQVDRARNVVESFATGLDEAKASELRDIFEHMFKTSADIREERKAGTLGRKEAGEQSAQLRTDTITDLTTLLGGEEFSRLRSELRRADASWF